LTTRLIDANENGFPLSLSVYCDQNDNQHHWVPAYNRFVQLYAASENIPIANIRAIFKLCDAINEATQFSDPLAASDIIYPLHQALEMMLDYVDGPAIGPARGFIMEWASNTLARALIDPETGQHFGDDFVLWDGNGTYIGHAERPLMLLGISQHHTGRTLESLIAEDGWRVTQKYKYVTDQFRMAAKA
jgi:hypothetical protein